MLLNIVATTDKKFIGLEIDTHDLVIKLGLDHFFIPEKISQIGSHLWRLASSTYVIDAREVQSNG